MFQTIKIKTRRMHFGVTDNHGRMFLQRRGVSQQLEYGNTEHKFYVIHKPGGASEVHADDTVTCFRPSQGLSAVEEFLSERAGAPLKFASETMAYCFAGPASTIDKDDLFFSPLRYEAGSDTIRHVPTNYCVVAFRGGKFAEPFFTMDRAAEFCQADVQKALSGGFHSCDTKQGDEHCKRRLAWLAGIYLIDSTKEDEIEVAVLGRDMSSTARLK